jgi:hypothetical protein
MRIDLQIPTSWQALTTEQLREVVELALKALSREEYLLVLFCRFAGLKMIASKEQADEKTVVRTKFKHGDIVFDLEDWQLSDFCGRLAFVLDEQMPMDVAWPWKWNQYLYNTSFGNWFKADAQMLGFALKGDTERLKAAMKYLGDPHDTLEPSDITLMLRWYDLFKNWLQERYPLVFQKSESGSEGPVSPVETRQNIMLMLNENRPQDNEAIEQSNVHDVLAALQHKIEYAKQFEEQMSNIKH